MKILFSSNSPFEFNSKNRFTTIVSLENENVIGCDFSVYANVLFLGRDFIGPSCWKQGVLGPSYCPVIGPRSNWYNYQAGERSKSYFSILKALQKKDPTR